jgi:hypothetical protein
MQELLALASSLSHRSSLIEPHRISDPLAPAFGAETTLLTPLISYGPPTSPRKKERARRAVIT